MKKNRLQQQTLDRFFRPGASAPAPRTPLAAAATVQSPSHLHNVINVDEEAMNEVLRSPAPTPAAPASTAVSDKVWLYGKEQVMFPWSPLNTQISASGQKCQVWDLIQQRLRAPVRVTTSEELRGFLAELDQLVDGQGGTFNPVRRAVASMPAEEQAHLFHEVLPWMKSMVLQAPDVFRDCTLPLLVQGETRRMVLSHEEAVTLMCCCFFSLFPQRSEAKKTPRHDRGEARSERSSSVSASSGGPKTMWVSRKLPCCNFSSLFSCTAVGRDASLDSKIRAFIEYFFCCHRHHANPSSVAHQRCVEVTRVSRTDFPAFEGSSQPLVRVSMRRTGLIEQDAEALQVDFANRFVGGGILRSGCVQEEIRMTLAPEMVLSRLFCEEMAEGEVIFISGTPDFCHAAGYAEKFRFKGGCDPWGPPESRPAGVAPAPALVPANAVNRRTQEPMLLHSVCVLAMDAHNFRVRGRPADQYRAPFLMREARKAYTGFCGAPPSFAVLPVVRSGAVASGHWGCGAFCGNKELKLLLQWCAASEAGGRELHYYTFDTPLSSFDALQDKLLATRWTVGKMMSTLMQYGTYRSQTSDAAALSPFQFVEQVCAGSA